MERGKRDFFTSSPSLCVLIPSDARRPVCSVTMATKAELFQKIKRHNFHTKVGGG